MSEVIRRLDDKLRAHISASVNVHSADTEKRRPDYPLAALQQLARNAIMHRSYEGTHAPIRVTWFSDRIEILNPGGPYGVVTVANFGQAGVTDYRNPHLAGYFGERDRPFRHRDRFERWVWGYAVEIVERGVD
ncbi:ATP-binding protein [Verminephrobacter aporrectodeae]|uniref:ATP-binding protein n=1 Tax=Verminephrobacter aporrectodeae TaxID=1110389 RepID=UPI0022381BF3|nr:ATP-binding protein [Verminephrobacter aporrectodeae]